MRNLSPVGVAVNYFFGACPTLASPGQERQRGDAEGAGHRLCIERLQAARPLPDFCSQPSFPSVTQVGVGAPVQGRRMRVPTRGFLAQRLPARIVRSRRGWRWMRTGRHEARATNADHPGGYGGAPAGRGGSRGNRAVPVGRLVAEIAGGEDGLMSGHLAGVSGVGSVGSRMWSKRLRTTLGSVRGDPPSRATPERSTRPRRLRPGEPPKGIILAAGEPATGISGATFDGEARPGDPVG